MHYTLVTGNLGNNPKIKTFENGGKVATFSVGVTERAYTTSTGIQVPQHTEWYDCVAKNGFADTVEKYVKKGYKVSIICVKHTRKYKDSENKERKIEEFVVKKLEILTPKDKRNEPVPAEEPLTPPKEDILSENKEELPF